MSSNAKHRSCRTDINTLAVFVLSLALFGCTPDNSHQFFRNIPDVAIGGIAAALITALVTGAISLINLVVTKENKVSEFRQDWINSLRTEISSLVMHATAIRTHVVASQPTGADTQAVLDTESILKMREDYAGIEMATTNIRLRLNPEEPLSIAVLNIVDKIEDGFNRADFYKLDDEILCQLQKGLVNAAKPLLKYEWRRVKTGELRYSIAVWALYTLTTALFCLICYLSYIVIISSSANL